MRFDLAGGWTDVPPFSAEVGGAVLNAAITRYARVTVQRRPDGQVSLASDDYHPRVEGLPEEALVYNGTLDMLKAAVRLSGVHDVTLRVSTESTQPPYETPPGAGLGSSGAVGVALLGAMNALRHTPWFRAELAERAFQMETVEVGIAGGRQDQVAALNGGFQFIEFHDPVVRSTLLALSSDLVQALRDNLVLCYTGRSRVSGNIISTVMGNYQRGEARTVYALHRLKAIAVEMRDALLSADLDGFAGLLAENWECQKMLDASVTNPQIDSLFSFATQTGAVGGKALGAGGGGCLLLYAPNTANTVRRTLLDHGVTLLEFDFDRDGLRVEGGGG